MNGLSQDLQHMKVGEFSVTGGGVKESLTDRIVYHGHLWQGMCTPLLVSAPTCVPVNVHQPLQFLKLDVFRVGFTHRNAIPITIIMRYFWLLIAMVIQGLRAVASVRL